MRAGDAKLVPSPRGRLAERTVVITGAGRGLGKGVCLAMAMEEATLWICDKTVDELGQAARIAGEFGATVHHRRFDISSSEACNRFAKEVLEGGSSVDCLVNNAGILPRTKFLDITRDEWERTLAINLTAGFQLSQLLLPAMESGGSIINVSSRAGVLGFAKQVSYCASKFAVEGFTRALAEDVDETVSVNSITPGMRIKPTNLTEAEEGKVPASDRVWKDPLLIAPAFIYLAMARGRPTGRRFDAERLTTTIQRHGYDMPYDMAEGIAQ